MDRAFGLVTDNRQQTTLIVVAGEDGLQGYGEANSHPAAVRAIVGDGLIPGRDGDLHARLVGQDLRDPVDAWERLSSAMYWSCRSGVGHTALAGVDMALWDLAGKAGGVPSWSLMGMLRGDRPEAYATLYHGALPYAETRARALDALTQAIELGFTAAKVEALAENAPLPDDIVALATAARELAGWDFTLLLDVGYRWTTYAEAAPVVAELEPLGLRLLETPFPPELTAEYRRLRECTPIPIGGCDILTAAVDYLPLLQLDAVDVLQAGASRTGIGDMRRLAELAAARGRELIPWGWAASTLTVGANLHVACVHENVPLVEYAPPALYPNAQLRNRLATPEPELEAGRFCVPERPGLGLDIDPELLAHFADTDPDAVEMELR